MKQGYSKSLRFVSILLLIALLMTSQTFSVFAAEAAKTIDEALLARIYEEIAQAREKAASGEDTEEKRYVTPEQKALLPRLGEYGSFTEEEKQHIRELFGVDSVKITTIDETKKEWMQMLENLPASAKYETLIAYMQKQGKVYSTLTDSEVALISEYLEYIDADDVDASSLFRSLEEKGYPLFQSVQIVQIVEDGLFTLEEALRIYGVYDDRPTRDANVKAFKNFASAFESQAVDAKAESENAVKDAKAEERDNLRKDKSKYIDENALQAAKEMLFDGYGAREIRAAYAVAATYDLNPWDLLPDKDNADAISESDEEENFFNIYPVDHHAFESKLREKANPNALSVADSSDALSATAVEAETDIDYAVATAEVMETSAALYSTASSNSNLSFVKPTLDSGVQQPFDASITDREQVSLNTGALQYSETLVSLPGINGNDMVLQITYDSSQSNLQDFEYTEIYDTFYDCYALYNVYVESSIYGTILYGSGEVYLGGVVDECDADSLWAIVPGDSICALDPPYIDEREVSGSDSYETFIVTDDVTGEIIAQSSDDSGPADEILYDDGTCTITLYCTGQEIVDEYTLNMGEDENGNTSTMYVTVWECTYSGTFYEEIDYGYITYTDIVTEGFDSFAYLDATALHTFNEKRYGVGAGWSFNIPSIDYESQGGSRLILPGVGSFAFYGNTFTDYKRKDMTLSDDDSYTAGQFPSDKKLTFADGTVYYFSEAGLLIAVLDRFGNTISYRYALVNGYYHPSEIIDTTGSSTAIAYADTDDGMTVTITAPDGSNTLLHVKQAGDAYDEGDYLLDSIVYPDGETIGFAYEMAGGSFSYVGEYLTPLDYVLLNKVTYDTGMQLHYKYVETLSALGDIGSMQFYQVVERYATQDGDDAITSDYIQYSYSGCYGDCAQKDEDYTYSTTVTQSSAAGTKTMAYTFDHEHRCTTQTIKVNGDLYQKVAIEYDTYDLPCKVVTTTYGSSTIQTTELYTHDKYGNTLTYISPKAEGSASNTEYCTTYTYDSGYQLPLTVLYKQDADTTVKQENILTDDAKNIAQTSTYVNDILAAKATYTYDDLGRVLTETVYPDVNLDNGIVTVYTYSKANLASKTVKNVVGNDGSAVDITVSYTYDTMGRPLTETDANENSTTYTYDVRGRVTSVTSPDGSMTAYTYNRIDNRTSVASSEREPMVYNYDALGRLETVVYASGDLTVESFYDANGRLIAEATNRRSTAAGTAYYTYDVFDRVTEKTVYDGENTLLYRETYGYDDAADTTTSLVTMTVHGDENAADIVTKTYTNQYGEKVKEDVGGVVTEYAYDYVGNPIRVYYDDTTLAAYTYDYAGNVCTETNADGNTRTVTYDDLGRKLTESDFKGNTTSYTYDNAGRLLTMTTPLTETKNSVTRYYYDANGNIVKQEQSTEAEDSDEAVWRTVEQVYDSMNRVTDIVNHVSDSVKQYTHYAYNLAGDLTDVYTGMTVPFAVAGEDSYSHIEYTYDRRGNNTAITDALGQTES